MAGIKHIDLQEDSQISYLFHRHLRIPVDTSLFEAVNCPFGSTSITTIDPLTLQHTFAVWGGIIRQEDLPRVRSLVAYNRAHGASRFTESDFEPFHQFLRARNKNYPWYARARKAQMAIASALPKPLENFLRNVYKEKDSRGGRV